MARKRTEIKAIRSNVPIYPIGVAARLLNVHPRTLRIYEQEGLVKPTIIGTRRMYSADDIQWITCLRTFIHEEGISIPGLKKLLDYVPCWEVADCPANIHERCSARVDWTRPRKPYPVGDAVAAQKAREEDRRTQETAAGEKKSAAHPPEPVPAGHPVAAGRRAPGAAVLRLIGGARCLRSGGCRPAAAA